MIASVWRGVSDDGTQVVVKVTGYDATLEADGLKALAEAGAPVPDVLHVDAERLVIEYVSGAADWEALGAALADVHRVTADRFGWRRDNVIGPLAQSNTWDDDWARFFTEQRIRPWLDAEALPSSIRQRLAAACDGPLPDLLGHQPRPSLIHGDLWSGNVVDGAYLIDPAVHYADRELELAFSALFGGIPSAFWKGYETAWPLTHGWERRRPALQLYHLLVHVELFGSGYVSQVAQRLDTLGW